MDFGFDAELDRLLLLVLLELLWGLDDDTRLDGDVRTRFFAALTALLTAEEVLLDERVAREDELELRVRVLLEPPNTLRTAVLVAERVRGFVVRRVLDEVGVV